MILLCVYMLYQESTTHYALLVVRIDNIFSPFNYLEILFRYVWCDINIRILFLYVHARNTNGVCRGVMMPRPLAGQAKKPPADQ